MTTTTVRTARCTRVQPCVRRCSMMMPQRDDEACVDVDVGVDVGTS